MITLLAFCISVLFLLLSAIHLYWVFGGKKGLTKVIPEIGGEPAFQPGALLTFIVAMALLLAAVITGLLGFYDLGSTANGDYIVYAGWFLAAVFALRAIGDFRIVGFFKTIKSSEFAYHDTRYYSPLCVVIAIAISMLSYHQL